MLELVDGDVGGEVVDAVQRLAEADGQRLRRRDADEQRAGETGTAGHRDRVDLVQRARRRSRRPARSSAPSPRGGPGWRPRGRRRRSARAPRRCWPRRRRAGCGRARCRRRSRRTRSRCRGPAAVAMTGLTSSSKHDRGRAVAVVARPAVQLDETTGGVEAEGGLRCPRAPRAAAGRPAQGGEHGVEQRARDAGTASSRRHRDPLQLDDVAGQAGHGVPDDDAVVLGDQVVHGGQSPADALGDEAGGPGVRAEALGLRGGDGLGVVGRGGPDDHETRLGAAEATASGRRR